jgi:alanyl-tRNA synthetase
MEEKEWVDFINGVLARIIFHLYDTHGYPLQYSKEHFIDSNDFIDLQCLFRTILLHRDFRIKEKEYAKSIRDEVKEGG